jgi:hypothetical protein
MLIKARFQPGGCPNGNLPKLRPDLAGKARCYLPHFVFDLESGPTYDAAVKRIPGGTLASSISNAKRRRETRFWALRVAGLGSL